MRRDSINCCVWYVFSVFLYVRTITLKWYSENFVGPRAFLRLAGIHNRAGRRFRMTGGNLSDVFFCMRNIVQYNNIVQNKCCHFFLIPIFDLVYTYFVFSLANVAIGKRIGGQRMDECEVVKLTRSKAEYSSEANIHVRLCFHHQYSIKIFSTIQLCYTMLCIEVFAYWSSLEWVYFVWIKTPK